MFINMLLTLLINGFRVPMFINMLITRLGIISPTLTVIQLADPLSSKIFLNEKQKLISVTQPWVCVLKLEGQKVLSKKLKVHRGMRPKKMINYDGGFPTF